MNHQACIRGIDEHFIFFVWHRADFLTYNCFQARVNVQPPIHFVCGDAQAWEPCHTNCMLLAFDAASQPSRPSALLAHLTVTCSRMRMRRHTKQQKVGFCLISQQLEDDLASIAHRLHRVSSKTVTGNTRTVGGWTLTRAWKHL